MPKENETLKRLSELERKIKSLQAEYKHLLTRGAAVARELGELLAEARSLVRPAHHWSKYCITQLDMTPGTAHRYVTIAKAWSRIEKHAMFPGLSVIQMFDVARGKNPRTRSYKLADQSLDVVLDILDGRLVEIVSDVPELESLLDAIDAARPVLEQHGLLNSQIEKRKKNAREQRRKADGSFA